MSPLLGDGYKAGGIGGTIKTHPLVPKDIVVRGFIKQELWRKLRNSESRAKLVWALPSDEIHRRDKYNEEDNKPLAQP